MNKGKVYLIGAGPGDPELLPLKGKRCLGEADVIVGSSQNLMLNIFMLAKKWAATR